MVMYCRMEVFLVFYVVNLVLGGCPDNITDCIFNSSESNLQNMVTTLRNRNTNDASMSPVTTVAVSGSSVPTTVEAKIIRSTTSGKSVISTKEQKPYIYPKTSTALPYFNEYENPSRKKPTRPPTPVLSEVNKDLNETPVGHKH